MIFAVINYINYRNLSGRFSLDIGDDIMCGAFCGALPDGLVEELEPGDPILLGNYDWWVAWLIMFFTSSQVSHIAMYAGSGKILHQTLSGPAFEPIENLYSPATRLLPFKLPQIRKRQKQPITEDVFSSYKGIPYPTGLVLRKAIHIVTGRGWKYFRFKFAADVFIFLLLITLPFSVMGVPLLIWLSLTYTALLFTNRVVSHFRPLPADDKHGKPCDELWQFPQIGGIPLVNHSSSWFKSGNSGDTILNSSK